MPIDEPVSFEPKAPAAEGRKPKSTASAPGQASPAELLAVTVDAASGRIVKIEGVDAAGARQELSGEQRERLAASAAKATREGVIEQAFQAGIDCVLGSEGGESEPAESKEDAELSRLLLRSLIERSGAKRLMRREVLHRAIVGTLIEQAAAPAGAAH
jgi:hypothetical protein